MYKVLEISLTAKCQPGISTEPGIYSHGRVHYRPQVGYHNTIISEKLSSNGDVKNPQIIITIIHCQRPKKKAVEREYDGDTSCNECTWNIHQGLKEGTGKTHDNIINRMVGWLVGWYQLFSNHLTLN